MNQPIFMDYLSTAPVDPRVVHVVARCMTEVIGNSSSTDHSFGTTAARVVDDARREIAELVGTKGSKVVFTSGATEAINIVIRHVARKYGSLRKPKIVVSPVEHSAVLETCNELVTSNQVDVVFLTVDQCGRLQIDVLEREVSGGVDLVCVMAANNEIGNTYPIKEIAGICNKYRVPFLCDASQSVGKVPIKFDDWELSYLIVSAHKMYGPKGAGAIVVTRQLVPSASQTGGNQEFGIRPGTVNVPAVAGFGEAARLRREEMFQDELAIASKRDRLQQRLERSVPGLVVNGDQASRLAGALHVSIAGVPNDAVTARLKDLLAISRGAACSSGIEKPSHVLLSMGMDTDSIEGSLRISLGKFTSDEEVEQAADLLIATVADVRSALGRAPYQKVC